MSHTYHCRACGYTAPEGRSYDHCPHCLSAIHPADMYDEACGGTLTPVGVWVKEDHSWAILGRCSVCGELAATPVAEGDNPALLLSLAHRPLTSPPFPIEKLEQMTAAMGGSGSTEGYDA